MKIIMYKKEQYIKNNDTQKMICWTIMKYGKIMIITHGKKIKYEKIITCRKIMMCGNNDVWK